MLQRIARNVQEQISVILVGKGINEGGIDMGKYYKECPICHAHLDPGECCDCEQEKEQESKRLQMLYVQDGKSDQLAFNWELEVRSEEQRKSERILSALDNSKVPISWHCIDESELIKGIAMELNRIEKEEEVNDE